MRSKKDIIKIISDNGLKDHTDLIIKNAFSLSICYGYNTFEAVRRMINVLNNFNP